MATVVSYSNNMLKFVKYKISKVTVEKTLIKEVADFTYHTLGDSERLKQKVDKLMEEIASLKGEMDKLNIQNRSLKKKLSNAN